jgi:hypothetical protein
VCGACRMHQELEYIEKCSIWHDGFCIDYDDMHILPEAHQCRTNSRERESMIGARALLSDVHALGDNHRNIDIEQEKEILGI